MEIGQLKNEICNRDGCLGIIAEHEKEGSCSCHINPPCSYCTTPNAYCPLCGWEAEDQLPPDYSKTLQDYYRKEQEEWKLARELFYDKFNGKLPADKLEMRSESHTHFSMIKRGVFPPKSCKREEIEKQVVGTFGGRFTLFTDTKFEYIAYTG